jgi:hypothetical protein
MRVQGEYGYDMPVGLGFYPINLDCLRRLLMDALSAAMAGMPAHPS